KEQLACSTRISVLPWRNGARAARSFASTRRPLGSMWVSLHFTPRSRPIRVCGLPSAKGFVSSSTARRRAERGGAMSWRGVLLAGVLLAGCSDPSPKPGPQPLPANTEFGRWVIVPASNEPLSNGTGRQPTYGAWRLDTKTGDLEFCSYYAGGDFNAGMTGP